MPTAADRGFLCSRQARVANGNGVKVKTFEEIMQEKRLRKQELEEQAKSSGGAEPVQKRAAERTLKRRAPSTRADAPTPKVPVRKLISLKSKASQSPGGSKESPDDRSKGSGEVKQAGAAQEPEQDAKGTAPRPHRA